MEQARYSDTIKHTSEKVQGRHEAFILLVFGCPPMTRFIPLWHVHMTARKMLNSEASGTLNVFGLNFFGVVAGSDHSDLGGHN